MEEERFCDACSEDLLPEEWNEDDKYHYCNTCLVFDGFGDLGWIHTEYNEE